MSDKYAATWLEEVGTIGDKGLAVLTRATHGLDPGDQLHTTPSLTPPSNRIRYRHFVDQVAETSFTLRTVEHRRPSRGYARHVRRMKQAKRRG
jgi:hypothetical protein